VRDFNKVDNNFYKKYKELIEDTLEGDALDNQVHMALSKGTGSDRFQDPVSFR